MSIRPRPPIHQLVHKHRGEAATRMHELEDVWRFPSSDYCYAFAHEARKYGYNVWESLDMAGLIGNG